MVFKLLRIVVVVMVLTSCSTISMQYNGYYRTDSGETGSVTYTNDYPVGNIYTWCWLTFWYFGGACWAYLTYPDSEQALMIGNDAESELYKKLGAKKIELNKTYVKRLGWGGQEKSLLTH